jgi:hypothetical protein
MQACVPVRQRIRCWRTSLRISFGFRVRVVLVPDFIDSDGQPRCPVPENGDSHSVHVVLSGSSPFRTGSTSKDVLFQWNQVLFGSTMPK